jgi:hypothetical protein
MRIHSVEGESGRPWKRGGFFARILEALHRSRRREAIRVLRRYRHLAAGQAQVHPVKPALESRATEKSSLHADENNAPARADRRTSESPATRFA